MIISYRSRYVFVQVPFTACTAVAQELQDCYAGISILRKHSSYADFCKTATPTETEFFLFAGVRNPLDRAVSHYFKLKTNHRDNYTNPRRWTINGGWVSEEALRQYQFIKNNNADFATFFMEYYRQSFGEELSRELSDCDYVIRYEYLQKDFSEALALLGILQLRSLPHRNPTEERAKEFHAYYPPEIRPRARSVFGPFMREWGYEFPREWNGG